MKIKTLLSLLIVLLLASCSDDESRTTPPVDIALTQNEQAVATKQNNFGFKLLRAAIKNETSPCVAVSTYSASQVLAMLANGANGETLSEVISALGDAGADINEINSYYKKLNEGLAITDKSTKFESVNAIWASKEHTFNNDFVKNNEEYYDALLKSFSTYEEITDWYKKNYSKDIYSSIENLLNGKKGTYNGLTINNTVYFNGKWQNKFEKSESGDNTFYGENGATKANMMTVKSAFSAFSGTHCSAIGMNYGNGAYSMMVVLPDEDSNTSEVLDDLCNDGLNGMKRYSTLVTVKMPKFTYTRTADLCRVFKAMGLSHIQPGEYPNITSGGFSIDKFIQYIYVNVDEDGTVVKASTSSPSHPTSPIYDFFLVNRPFIWIIKENSTNTILFLGKVGAV